MKENIKKNGATDLREGLARISKLIDEIGKAQRRIEQTENNAEEAIASINRETDDTISKLQTEIDTAAKLIEDFAIPREGLLTKNGRRKKIRVANGYLRWKLSRLIVHVHNTQKAIAALRRRRLYALLHKRVVLSINKGRAKENPSLVRGIRSLSVERHKQFIIVPRATKLEVVRPLGIITKNLEREKA